MPKHGKKYLEARKGFDPQHVYAPAEAVDLVKSLAKANFDETVELAVRLGVDPARRSGRPGHGFAACGHR